MTLSEIGQTGANVLVAGRFAVALDCIATRTGETAWADRRHSAHAVLTGLLDRSALYGVLAEIEALGLNVLEVPAGPDDGQFPEGHRVG